MVLKQQKETNYRIFHFQLNLYINYFHSEGKLDGPIIYFLIKKQYVAIQIPKHSFMWKK